MPLSCSELVIMLKQWEIMMSVYLVGAELE